MEVIKIAICDDDKIAVSNIEKMLENAKHLRHELNLYNTKIIFITSKEKLK